MAAPSLAGAISGPGRFLRPTAVTPRASGFGRQNIGIQIVGLRDAQRIPEQLRATYERMMTRLALSVQRAAREAVPGGATGRLGRQVFARKVGTRIVVGTVNSEFARALNRGFTSKAQKGRALRFNDGGSTFYRPKVRVAGRHFYEKWLVITPPIVEATYESAFYNIKDLF